MVLEIARLVLSLGLLACGFVGAWSAHAIHRAHARSLVLLDAQEREQRRALAEDAREREVWQKEVHVSLRDARALLGKLYALAAEHSPHERDTHVMPPPEPALLAASTPEDDEASDSDAETRCMDKGLALAALAAARSPSSSSSSPETLRESSRE